MVTTQAQRDKGTEVQIYRGKLTRVIKYIWPEFFRPYIFKSLYIGLRTEGPVKTIIVVPVISRILKAKTYRIIL
jgi:hypothetical protein